MQLTHSLKAPGFNPCACQVVENWFLAFAFKFTLYRYTMGIKIAKPSGDEESLEVGVVQVECR
jgi:hypothetical protein